MKDLEQAAPVNEELTEKDRLQQARGGSNLLEDPKFTKYLNVKITVTPESHSNSRKSINIGMVMKMEAMLLLLLKMDLMKRNII